MRQFSRRRDTSVFNGGGELSLSQACELFSSLPHRLQVPSLSPEVTATDAMRTSSARAVYWGFALGNDVILKSFLLSTVKVEGKAVTDIQSPYGSGGVLSSSDHFLFRRAALMAFREWALAADVVVEFLRLHPFLHNQHLYAEEVWENRMTVEVPLTPNVMSGYSSRKRNYLRNELQRNPILKQMGGESGIDDFITLYFENMEVVNAPSDFLFPIEYFRRLIQTRQATLWGLIYPEPNGLLAAAITLESESSRLVEYFLGASRRKQGFRSMELLLHLIAQRYADAGFRSFYLGGGRSDSPDDALLRFKRSFSKKERPYSIGRNVYQPEVYRGLLGSDLTEPPRVLFYRTNGS